MDRASFVAATGCEHWATVDEYVAMLDQAGFWDRPAEPERKRAYVQLRLATLLDDSGWPVFGHITEITPDGARRDLYKQEALFTLDDYARIIAWHNEQAERHEVAARAMETDQST